jgi:hypothetical protein
VSETKKKRLCPECSQVVRYDWLYHCWVCDQCDTGFYEDEGLDDREQEDEEG